MISTLRELAEYVGAAQPTVTSISHRLYKETECGASLSVYSDTGPHHNGSDYDGSITGVQVNSICEGGSDSCDAEFVGDLLVVPFAGEAFDQQVQGIEDQVAEHWAEFHDLEES